MQVADRNDKLTERGGSIKEPIWTPGAALADSSQGWVNLSVEHETSEDFSTLNDARYCMQRKLVQNLQRVFLGKERFARRLGVTIGTGCRILTHDFGSEPFLVSVGDNTTLSHGVRFINHDGAAWLVRDARGRRYSYRRIRVGNRCFVGANTLLMPGVDIGDEVVIAAGSVVTKSVPDGCVVGGNPARFIKSFKSYSATVLAEWVAEEDLPSCVSYRSRVMAGVDESFKPRLAVPDWPAR